MRVARHGAVDGVRFFGLDVLGRVVSKEEEELLLAIEEPGHAYRSADRTGPVIRAAWRLRADGFQLLGEGRVARGFSLLDAPPIPRIGGALRGVQPLLPVLP